LARYRDVVEAEAALAELLAVAEGSEQYVACSSEATDWADARPRVVTKTASRAGRRIMAGECDAVETAR
jgi:hypothetical protein